MPHFDLTSPQSETSNDFEEQVEQPLGCGIALLGYEFWQHLFFLLPSEASANSFILNIAPFHDERFLAQSDVEEHFTKNQLEEIMKEGKKFLHRVRYYSFNSIDPIFYLERFMDNPEHKRLLRIFRARNKIYEDPEWICLETNILASYMLRKAKPNAEPLKQTPDAQLFIEEAKEFIEETKEDKDFMPRDWYRILREVETGVQNHSEAYNQYMDLCMQNSKYIKWKHAQQRKLASKNGKPAVMDVPEEESEPVITRPEHVRYELQDSGHNIAYIVGCSVPEEVVEMSAYFPGDPAKVCFDHTAIEEDACQRLLKTGRALFIAKPP